MEFIRSLGPARLAAMGAVAAGLIGFFIFLVMRLSQPQMGVLFTDLVFEDSIAIVNRLEAMNVPHELRQDGAIVLVPRERVLRLRMDLAGSGLPAGGAVGYEIFDKGDTLGATSFVQNVNRLRAVEGELARTIRALDRVEMARVHLVLPQRQLFARSAPEPTASIVIRARGAIDAGHIKAIQHLVASAVEGMRPASVSVVDDSGRLLASGKDDEQEGPSLMMDDRHREFERRMQREIEDIVASVVGAGRARVRVNAEIDYSRVTRTSDTFDPESRVIRSTQVREEASSTTGQAGEAAVTVANELPAADAGAQQGAEQESGRKQEEVVNFEISRVTQTEVLEGGRIKRLSVAVLVDGMYQSDGQGGVTYTQRPQEQLDEISALVRTAMGFDDGRGDQLHVSNLRFADNEHGAMAPQAEEGQALTRSDYFRMAELIVIILVALLVLLFVVRPLVRRIITPEGPPELGTVARPPARLPPPESGDSSEPPALAPPVKSRATEVLKNARIEGEVQAHAIRDVGGVVQNHRDEAVSIVRQWIREPA